MNRTTPVTNEELADCYQHGGPKKRPLVIIEAPYAQDPPRMTEYLRACIQDCLLRGEAPIASVATFVLTGALDDLKPEQRAEGIAAGLAWYRGADRSVAYTDHGISAGMQMGMAAAQQAGVPVEVRELGAGVVIAAGGGVGFGDGGGK